MIGIKTTNCEEEGYYSDAWIKSRRNETGRVKRRGDRARQGEIKRRGNGLVNRTPETSKFSPTRPLAKEDKNEKKNRYEIGSCNFFSSIVRSTRAPQV